MIQKTFLRLQFFAAKKLGYLKAIEAAATEKFPVHLLLAIASRETNLNPYYATHPGDKGNGFSLFQIDKRSHYTWLKNNNWKDQGVSAKKAVEILNGIESRVIIASSQKVVIATTLQGKSYSTLTKAIPIDRLLQIVVASYNCGMWSYYHFCKGRDIDTGTTGKDYSKDVLYRAKIFKELYEKA